MHPPEVVCLGLATLDTIVRVPSWPEPDGRVVADALLTAGGGPAATAAVTLARLGHAVALAGAIGDDDAGQRIRSELDAVGVDTRLLRTLPGRSASSVIVLDRGRGSRAILHAPGAALQTLDDETVDVCRHATWVHLDHCGWSLGGPLDHARMSVDAGHRIDGLELRGLGLYAPSEAALLERYPGRALGGAVASALADGAERVAVTLGARGAIAADASGAWRCAAPQGIQIESTLGAGDVFHGALLAALLDGDRLADATRRATVAATLSCRAIDGRGAIPDGAELAGAIADAPPVEPIELEEVE